jgi:DNA binding domain, excisionase family
MKEYELLKQYKDVLTPVELKEILGIGMNGVYSLLKSGKITSFKVGSQFRITKSSLLDYLQNGK